MATHQASHACIMATTLKGAAHKYLYANAASKDARSFWRSTLGSVAYFVLDRSESGMNQKATFGGEGSHQLSKIGDMCREVCIVVDLPGLHAGDTRADVGGGVAGDAAGNTPTRYPSALDRASGDGNEHDFCESEDEAFWSSYGGSGKDQWLQDQHGASALIEDYADPVAATGLAAWACWCNAVGLAMFSEINLHVGGQTHDTVKPLAHFFLEELEGDAGKRYGEMVGKRDELVDLLVDSAEARKLYVPCPFYFSRDDKDALPLVSMTFSGVQISVKIRPLTELVIQSHDDIEVQNAATGQKLASDDLKVAFETTYVYASHEERMKFALGRYTILFKQFQYAQGKPNSDLVSMILTFNHPVIELMFAVRRACNEKMNSWFNLSGVDGRDPIVSASLHLNGMAHTSEKGPGYLRMWIPFTCHKNIPKAFVYVISFSPVPGDRKVAGTINFSRLENSVFTAKLQPALAGEDCTLYMVASNWNMTRVHDGSAGLSFLG